MCMFVDLALNHADPRKVSVIHKAHSNNKKIYEQKMNLNDALGQEFTADEVHSARSTIRNDEM